MKSLGKPQLLGSAYEPDSNLVADIAIKYRLDQAKLVKAFVCFGPLPLSEQQELGRSLVAAFARFENLGDNVQTVTGARTRKQILAIRTAAKRLLLLLGFSPSNPLGRELLEALMDITAADFVNILDHNVSGQQSEVGTVARMQLISPDAIFEGHDEPDECRRRAANEALRVNADRCNDAIRSLWWIQDRAKAALDRTRAVEETNTRGGARRGRTQAGQLVEDALIVYAKMRKRNPESGNKPGFGGPMLCFVTAVTELFGAAVADSLVKEVWKDRRRWQSNLE